MITTPQYWECECQAGYYHSREETMCFACAASAHDQPDVMAHELLESVLYSEERNFSNHAILYIGTRRRELLKHLLYLLTISNDLDEFPWRHSLASITDKLIEEFPRALGDESVIRNLSGITVVGYSPNVCKPNTEVELHHDIRVVEY